MGLFFPWYRIPNVGNHEGEIKSRNKIEAAKIREKRDLKYDREKKKKP